MKTITEFSGIAIRHALKTADELRAGGKTAEELSQALGEALKVEGDKLKLTLAAMEIAQAKPNGIPDLKRVMVYALHEGETAPTQTTEKEGHQFICEYLPSLHPKQSDRRGAGAPGEQGEKGGRGGRGGRGGKDQKGKRGSRGPRGANGPAGEERRGPNLPKTARPPRPPAAQPASGSLGKIIVSSAGPSSAPKITPVIRPKTEAVTEQKAEAGTES